MKRWIKDNPESFTWIVIFIFILVTMGLGAVIIGAIFIAHLKNIDIEEEVEEVTDEEAVEELALLLEEEDRERRDLYGVENIRLG
ncbi:MAG: hypothetical protein EF811_03890 [Methanonatronarchaeia archaeon]|nr:MAG: hypothetical protein EF811_03890 [Methanonatronarchaeia archaeon]